MHFLAHFLYITLRKKKENESIKLFLGCATESIATVMIRCARVQHTHKLQNFSISPSFQLLTNGIDQKSLVILPSFHLSVAAKLLKDEASKLSKDILTFEKLFPKTNLVVPNVGGLEAKEAPQNRKVKYVN